MSSKVSTDVDYRRSDSGQAAGGRDNGPFRLSECLAELVDGIHTECWEAIRCLTRVRGGLTAEYVVNDDRSELLASVHAWKTVTCPVCSDTWRLSGYGMTPEEVSAARRVVLAALTLGLPTVRAAAAAVAASSPVGV